MDEDFRPMTNRLSARSGSGGRSQNAVVENSRPYRVQFVDEDTEFISETVTLGLQNGEPASSEVSVSFDPESKDPFGENGIRYQGGSPGSSGSTEYSIEAASSDFGGSSERSYETISTDGSVTSHTCSDTTTDGEGPADRRGDNFSNASSAQSGFRDDTSDSDARSIIEGVDYQQNLRRLMTDAEANPDGAPQSIMFEHGDTNEVHFGAIPADVKNGRPVGGWVQIATNNEGQCLGQSLTWLENVHDLGMDPKDAKPDDYLSGWRQTRFHVHVGEREQLLGEYVLDDPNSIKLVMEDMGALGGEHKIFPHVWDRGRARPDQFAEALGYIAKEDGAYIIAFDRVRSFGSGRSYRYGHAVAASNSQGQLTLYDPNNGAVSTKSTDEDDINSLAKALSNEYRLEVNIPKDEQPDGPKKNSVHVIQYGIRRERANPRNLHEEAGTSIKRPSDESRQNAISGDDNEVGTSNKRTRQDTKQSEAHWEKPGGSDKQEVIGSPKNDSSQDMTPVRDPKKYRGGEPVRELELRQRDDRRNR